MGTPTLIKRSGHVDEHEPEHNVAQPGMGVLHLCDLTRHAGSVS
jgi:hypothetical protein